MIGAQNTIWTPALAPGPASGSPYSDVMAYWALEEASGSRAATIGGQALSEEAATSSAAGKNGNAASFNATAILSHAYNLAVQPGIAGNGATWSCWFRRSADPVSGSAGLMGENTATNPNCGFRINTGGKISGFVRASGAIAINSSAGSSLCDDAWHHVVYTYSIVDKKLKGYVDGALHITSAGTGTQNALTDNSVGNCFGRDRASQLWGVDSPTTALIDEVALWDRALTLDEIVALYAGGAGIFL